MANFTTEKKIYLQPVSPTKLVDGKGNEFKCPKDNVSKERVSRAFKEGDRAVKIMDKDGTLLWVQSILNTLRRVLTFIS